MRPTSFLLLFGTTVLGAACAGGGSSNPSDGSSPMVQITAPAPGATVGGQVSIDANVTDDFGVDVVKFFVDDVQVSEQFSPPFHYSWNATTVPDNTNHSLRVDGLDLAKNRGTQTISVHVSYGNQ